MPYEGFQLTKLQAERDKAAYDGMDNATFLAAFNALTVDAPRSVMSAGEILDTVDKTELIAVLADPTKKAYLDLVLGAGSEIIIGPTNDHMAVDALQAAFAGSGGVSIAALAALRAVKISPAQAAGLPPADVAAVSRTT